MPPPPTCLILARPFSSGVYPTSCALCSKAHESARIGAFKSVRSAFAWCTSAVVAETQRFGIVLGFGGLNSELIGKSATHSLNDWGGGKGSKANVELQNLRPGGVANSKATEPRPAKEFRNMSRERKTCLFRAERHRDKREERMPHVSEPLSGCRRSWNVAGGSCTDHGCPACWMCFIATSIFARTAMEHGISREAPNLRGQAAKELLGQVCEVF